MKKEDKLNDQIKPRLEYRFYSNVLNITVTGSDAFIDFMQFPPENNEAPTVRVYLSHDHLKDFYNVLAGLPLIQEENQNKE
jgi:hypothetical protein